MIKENIIVDNKYDWFEGGSPINSRHGNKQVKQVADGELTG